MFNMDKGDISFPHESLSLSEISTNNVSQAQKEAISKDINECVNSIRDLVEIEIDSLRGSSGIGLAIDIIENLIKSHIPLSVKRIGVSGFAFIPSDNQDTILLKKKDPSFNIEE